MGRLFIKNALDALQDMVPGTSIRAVGTKIHVSETPSDFHLTVDIDGKKAHIPYKGQTTLGMYNHLYKPESEETTFPGFKLEEVTDLHERFPYNFRNSGLDLLNTTVGSKRENILDCYERIIKLKRDAEEIERKRADELSERLNGALKDHHRYSDFNSFTQLSNDTTSWLNSVNRVKKSPVLGSDEDSESVERRFIWQREEEKVRNALCGYPLMSGDFFGYTLESRMMRRSLEMAKASLQRPSDGFEAAREKTCALLNIRPLSSAVFESCTYHSCWG